MRALFLTWDGPQQSYLESLFFPIFAGLAARGIEVHTLQLTWANAEQLAPAHRAAARWRLPYVSRSIPRRLRTIGLPATLALGAVSALRYARQHAIGTLLPRSLIPMGMALLARRARPDLDLVFEADGLMADERVDFGGWSRRGAGYRMLRRIEASGVRQARSVVCRTRAARETLISRAGDAPAHLPLKIFVAANAKNSDEFSPGSEADRLATRARHGIDPLAPWIVYTGSIGPQYLPETMLAAMAELRRRSPPARFSIFTFHREALEPLLPRYDLASAVQIAPALPVDVPRLLAASDLGFALRLDAFSQRGICPIKVAEYLLCGVPVVTSPVGDLAEQLGGQPAALLLDAAAERPASSMADWFMESVLPRRESLRSSARELGLRWFDLAKAVDIYERTLRYRASPKAHEARLYRH